MTSSPELAVIQVWLSHLEAAPTGCQLSSHSDLEFFGHTAKPW